MRTLGEGRYELESRLNEGGMGEVWTGRDTKLDRKVAVKFIRAPGGAPDPEDVRRFVRESRITARLQHPGVPAIYDGGADEHGWPFLVMQQVEGVDVEQLLAEQGPLPIGWAAAIAAQICSVLTAAHAASLIHRDLKPSNVMLEPDGCVKVLDFGLATAATPTEFSRITRPNQRLGSPPYMAPEQVDAGMCSPATDLYALGCTLHEMLTGTTVFDGSSVKMMIKHINEPPPPLRSIRPEVPAELERLVLDLLEKEPDARPAGAHVVYERLLPFVTDLGPLVGALDPPTKPSPVRMQAGILDRVFRDGPVAAPAPATATTAEPAVAPITRAELVRVREEAGRLIEQSRFEQASAALKEAAGPARHAFGDTDEDVLRVRQDLAHALFEGGDYHGAAPVYQALAADLAGRGPSEAVFEYRRRAATCASLIGQSGDALRQLDDLLADERAAYGESDPRVRELRKQIGLLQLGAGLRRAARQTLSSLLADLRERPGGGPDPDELAALLAHLWPIDDGWRRALAHADRDEPGLDALLHELAYCGAPTPVVGFELGPEGWLAEAAWPGPRVAIVAADPGNPETAERDAAYAAAGWDARTAIRWTADELADRVLPSG